MSYRDDEMLSIPSVTGEDVKEQPLSTSEPAGPHDWHLTSLKMGRNLWELQTLWICLSAALNKS